MNTSLYLSQSYKDAWDDYRRSLTSPSFPTWDYIILTASNEHQAESFRAQIESRREYLPARTTFAVIPDEGGVRVGSGGATLSVLKWLREQEDTFNKRILVIHSGGDSKRVPQYSALGKLFSPVPHTLPDGRSSTLFDEFIISMSSVPGRIREGMLLLSGDVMLLFNPLLIDYSGHGAAVISFKEDVETGKDHGVYLRGEDGNVRSFLHKQSVEKLRKVGAVNSSDSVDIDTGAIIFGTDVLNSLWSLISTDDFIDNDKYNKFVNDRVRLSLYGDFQYPLASDSTLEQFYLEKPEGDYSDELNECRKAVWNVLRQYRLKLLRLAPAKFIHFGTTREILHLMNEGVKSYAELGWDSITNSSAASASYNSVISPEAKVGSGTYAEVSLIHSDAVIGEGSILSYIDVENEVIPSHVVLHGLKQSDGNFVCRIFGIEDNPKENKLFGKELVGDYWEEDEPHVLWTAGIYPECTTIKEAVSAALDIYNKMTEGLPLRKGKSLAAGFNDADPKAILDWNGHMEELISMNRIGEMIAEKTPASKVQKDNKLADIEKKWLNEKLGKAEISEKMRLQYYTGVALGGTEGEKHIQEAFKTLSDSILENAVSELKEVEGLKIAEESVEVSLPLRVNWGGGWSDTPPYCIEEGGTVLNAAILLNGERPVKVNIKQIDEKQIVFDSRDMDVHGEFSSINELQSVGNPFDPFVLQKAAFLACGVIPMHGGNLTEILDKLGSGISMDTEVTGVPKGSGLGTSSILAAACVKAISSFFGLNYTEDELYSHVLCMEQIMSTGGGWQDQVGGVTDGIKYITSRPGIKQKLTVSHIELDQETLDELNHRFTLIYTGQRRLARNLLRDVVGRYIGNEPDAVYALNEIQRMAALMRFELERGRIDAFAELLSKHWELSKMIDAGSTNTLIDQIFDSIEDLIDGKMVCGAGGGGFLQVVTKKDVTVEQLQERLKLVFSDTDINVWKCTLV